MQNDFFLYPSCENNKVPSLILQTDLIVFWHWSHSDYFKVFRFAKSLVGTKNLRSVFKKEKISFHFRDSSSPVCFNPFAPFHFISNLIFFSFLMHLNIHETSHLSVSLQGTCLLGHIPLPSPKQRQYLHDPRCLV